MRPPLAFFETEIAPVVLSHAYSTDHVMVMLKKFQKQLIILEKDCEEEGKKALSVIKGKAKGLEVGMLCLAKGADGKWKRGHIIEEAEPYFLIYYIDRGSEEYCFQSDVIPIPQNLIIKLPCQGIECRLAGVAYNNSKETVGKILSFSGEHYISIISKQPEGFYSNGAKYVVNVVNLSGISLNKFLVDNNMAPALEEEKQYLVDLSPIVDPEKKEESEEDSEDDDEQKRKELEGVEEILMELTMKELEGRVKAKETLEEKKKNLKPEKKVETHEEKKTPKPSKSQSENQMSEEYILKNVFENDSLFEDENAMEFLQEFAEKFLGARLPMRTPPATSRPSTSSSGDAKKSNKKYSKPGEK